MVQPEPDPTSSTRWPGRTSSSSSIALDRARLAVGLAVADVERAVVPRPPPLRPREEPLARLGRHRGRDAPGGVHGYPRRSASAVSTARWKVG